MKITRNDIRKARKALGISQEEFGHKLGMSGTNISMMERGLITPVYVDEGEHNFNAWMAVLSNNKEEIESLPNPLAAWLRRTRIKKGLSINELSSKSGVDSFKIRSIERGERLGRLSYMPSIEAVLEESAPMSTDELAKKPENSIPGVGSLTDFDPYDTRNLPSCSGIYVFYDVSERPIYIGESKNIKKRLKQHEEKFWFKSPVVEYGSYIDIEDDGLRKGIEQILIQFLRSNAVLNKQHVKR